MICCSVEIIKPGFYKQQYTIKNNGVKMGSFQELFFL
jgi:hypothetical protein